MEISEFKKILTAFADEPADVDVRLGRVVAQIRDDIVEAKIEYSGDGEQRLIIVENDQRYPARLWLINRVARIPQLADKIILATTVPPEYSTKSPFVTPEGSLVDDLAISSDYGSEIDVPDAVESLIKKASQPLPGATSVVYLTSDAGEGKTTVINKVAQQQATRFKDKKCHSLVVPIPLGGRAFLTFDDAVIAALVNRLRFNYLYFDAFMALVRMGVLVPAFDGYEEMLVQGGKGEAVSALGNLVQSLNSSGTVIVAARKAFFEYLSFKEQARLLDAIGDRSASFSRLSISRWSKNQFIEYGKLRGHENPEDVYSVVSARLSADHPLLTRAVLVRRLFDVVGDGTQNSDLAKLLGSSPHDYFYKFVDAIVRREASEKWLSRVSGEVNEPLISIDEHHELLSSIAQEMWQSAVSALRYDVIDAIVDIYAETRKKNAIVIRQIKERIRQHSLLASGNGKSGYISFDHEDFQNFYLGESLGSVLAAASVGEIRAFLSVGMVSNQTIEQSVQCVIRRRANISSVLKAIFDVNDGESGFSFCKENCGTIAIRLLECRPDNSTVSSLDGMFFPANSLQGRDLRNVQFSRCQFQPTSVINAKFYNCLFSNCEFERMEIDGDGSLSGILFDNCRIDSMNVSELDEQSYDPDVISRWILQFGADILGHAANNDGVAVQTDDKLKMLERFLRVFLRSTHVDEEIIRLRLGKTHASTFIDDLLPDLLSAHVLEETPWKGGGVQRRFKLGIPLSQVNDALERSKGKYRAFLEEVAKG